MNMIRTCLLFLGLLLAWHAGATAWRGLMIDTSRHFPEISELHALLPMLKDAGLNGLHLHLSDGPGWRFYCEAYPRLTDIGSWRVDKTDQPWNWRETVFWDKTYAVQGLKKYGGYYTPSQLRALTKDAKAHGITIIPELDIPSHAAALLTAYPELACPTNRDPKLWFLGQDVVCIGNPKTLQVLTELFLALGKAFPGSPLHIGCDEVPTTTWDRCPHCKEPSVRKHFYAQLIANLQATGHTVCAWDELGQTGVDVSKVILFCWNDHTIPRAQDIVCPYRYCYLDQAASRARLPHWQIPRHVYGAQINLWTEEMPTREIRTRIINEGLRSFRQALNRSAITP